MLSIAFVVVAQLCVFLAVAYFFVGRGGLPAFLPHARSVPRRDDATDAPMGAVMLGIAVALVYSSYVARVRRSWLRSRSWHRKHGRI